MPYIEIAIAVAFAVFFFRAAREDGKSQAIWTALSVLFSFLSAFVLVWGLVGSIASQVALFGIMFLCNVVRARMKERCDGAGDEQGD